MSKLQDLKRLIKNILINVPTTRDSDKNMLCLVWEYELNSLKMLECKATEFFELYSTHKVSNADSVSRIKRKLQEEIPELRGEKWEERRTVSQKVKDDMKGFFKNKSRQEVREEVRELIKKI